MADFSPPTPPPPLRIKDYASTVQYMASYTFIPCALFVYVSNAATIHIQVYNHENLKAGIFYVGSVTVSADGNWGGGNGGVGVYLGVGVSLLCVHQICLPLKEKSHENFLLYASEQNSESLLLFLFHRNGVAFSSAKWFGT